MTSNPSVNAADRSRQLAVVQAQATKLINRLYDRAAYVSDDEFADIMSLVQAMRQFCGLRAAPAEGAEGHSRV